MTQPETIEALRAQFGEAIGESKQSLEIASPGRMLEIAFFLRDELHCDALNLISSLDNGDGTLSVVYHLESTKLGHRLALKVTVPSEDAHVPSVTSVWLHANWQEREAWDMMGIRFEGHPDHRRILLDDDYPGHPLRKDFKEPDFYHGMKVPY